MKNETILTQTISQEVVEEENADKVSDEENRKKKTTKNVSAKIMIIMKSKAHRNSAGRFSGGKQIASIKTRKWALRNSAGRFTADNYDGIGSNSYDVS